MKTNNKKEHRDNFNKRHKNKMPIEKVIYVQIMKVIIYYLLFSVPFNYETNNTISNNYLRMGLNIIWVMVCLRN